MCGIVGLVNRPGDAVDRALLESMTRVLRHRGPDAEGFHIHRRVGLGHRRLSVIDTSELANQPMFNEDGTVAVVFNGEIYNFRQLGQALESEGHRFRTRSDTEVLVHAWEEYGPDCVQHLRGMFAFGIYDASRERFFLARDRIGKKPLYYWRDHSAFAFASEIKSLRLLPDVPADLDESALLEYATHGNTLGEGSIFRAIRRLLPAHCMSIDLSSEDLDPQVDRYWSPRAAPDENLTESDWLELLDREISESVRMRMVSDVPLGAFLSGGIDSSLVLAYMAEHSDRPVKTFTMTFEESSHDESDWARQVASHFGCDHHEQLVRPDAVDIVDTLTKVYDEPFADESAIPTFYLSEMTRQQVTVALSGDGGDEGFLGYDRYPYSLYGSHVAGMLTPVGRAAVRQVADRLPWSARAKRYLERFSHGGFAHYLHAMGHSPELTGILRPKTVEAALHRESKLDTDDRNCPSRSLLSRFSWSDLLNYLPDDVLVKVDRASMFHSLEVRCPLLDHQVLEVSRRIPIHHNLRGLVGKRLLRKLLARKLPGALTERPKRGFGVPITTWFRGPLAPMIDEMLADTASVMWLYFDHAAVQQRWQAHTRGRADLRASLWRSLFFYRWSRSTLEG